MNQARLNRYVISVCVAALVAAMLTDWGALADLPRSGLFGLAGLIAIGVLSEAMAIGLSVGGTASTSSITFLPLLAGVQLFGPAAGVLLVAVTQVFGEFVVRRKGTLKGSFNVAQMILATSIGGWAFSLLGGIPIGGQTGSAEFVVSGQIWPFVTLGLVVLAVNHAAVSMAITLSQGYPFRRVWELLLSNSGASLHDILISPVALAVAFLYVQFGVAGILVVILPMLFIRHSYVTASRLREANEDLLTALVKAIETRDPYTSGHSQRVSQFARRIADELGLARRTAEKIETAALLHDIGKIEATYTEILAKPESLTPEERSVIESHVIIGEQLLRDLSSVPEDVVLAVRHHHEREDGRGYPDGLVGAEIPLGAKIIAICDAVDAMLSDRPYRRALPLPVVIEQLQEHAGRQFDARIVQVLLSSTILKEYGDLMRTVRESPEFGQGTPTPRFASGSISSAARIRQAWAARAYN